VPSSTEDITVRNIPGLTAAAIQVMIKLALGLLVGY